MNCELKERKHIRLKTFDYSNDGDYFVTICTHNRRCFLSKITYCEETNISKNELTPFGRIAEEELISLKKRYPFIDIDIYCIMPNHIHFIICFNNNNNKKSTLPKIIGAYKSLVTRRCKSINDIQSVFQRSFYERIIRNDNEYYEFSVYTENNPLKWGFDELNPDFLKKSGE